jgi:hypothetical protein
MLNRRPSVVAKGRETQYWVFYISPHPRADANRLVFRPRRADLLPAGMVTRGKRA